MSKDTLTVPTRYHGAYGVRLKTLLLLADFLSFGSIAYINNNFYYLHYGVVATSSLVVFEFVAIVGFIYNQVNIATKRYATGFAALILFRTAPLMSD